MIRMFNQYVSRRSVLLMLTESVLVGLSLLVAARLRFWNDPAEFAAYTRMPVFGLQVLSTVIVFQLCLYLNELYDLAAIRIRGEQLLRLWESLGASCILLGVLFYIAPVIEVGRGVFFISFGFSALLLCCSRLLAGAAFRATSPRQNVLVVGAGELAGIVNRELARRHDLNMHVVGCVNKSGAGGGSGQRVPSPPVLGASGELETLVEKHHVSRVIVALEDQREALPVRCLVNLRVQGVPVEDATSVLAGLTGRVWLRTVRPSWFVYSGGFNRSRWLFLVKRGIDLAFSAAGLVLTAPLMAAVAIAVRWDSPGPILFRQVRVGWRGRHFAVLKFRSMRVDAEAAGAQWAQAGDPRVTRVGRFIRKYRLDELPQFWNVIRGEMSFVGPRPERPVFVEQLKKEIPYFEERHSMRPGITGWAQVQYPYGASTEDAYNKLEYDLFYLQNLSITFDFAIVFQTLRIVLFGRGR
jgi:sugar transferase (PEP-CTERM system associated)